MAEFKLSASLEGHEDDVGMITATCAGLTNHRFEELSLQTVIPSSQLLETPQYGYGSSYLNLLQNTTAALPLTATPLSTPSLTHLLRKTTPKVLSSLEGKIPS